jgi:hypothetical protein
VVAGASEVRLPDRGGNPAAVARGDCLRVAVDVLPSGKLGWEFLAGYAGRKELPLLAGADRCRRSGACLVPVLCDGTGIERGTHIPGKRHIAVLPSSGTEKDADNKIRGDG